MIQQILGKLLILMDPITGLPSSRRSTLSDDAHREGLTTETHDWTLVKAIDLVADQKVVVMQILTRNNISSAPVYDASTKSYSGMFDWADVMTYLLIVLKKKDASKQLEKTDAELSAEFNDLVKLASHCQPVPVKLASDLSKKNPFYSVLPETSLLQVVELFGSGTHRVAVVDANGIIKGILTQSRVVNYFYQNVTKFPPIEQLFPKTLNELDIGKVKNGLSSIAIVDSEGMLLGNISMTDVKYVLRSYSHSLMWKTCHQFVSHVRSGQGLEDGQDRYPVFDVRPTSTLGYTIAKLSATKAHRLWVIDEQMRAVGVVSLTDVLLIFARSAGANPKPKRVSSLSLSSPTNQSE
ncbi:13245_t:CDS:10 [Gigaspora rosea]|nr:13245_t:CDS:10 [Gigaspora rosea]